MPGPGVRMEVAVLLGVLVGLFSFSQMFWIRMLVGFVGFLLFSNGKEGGCVWGAGCVSPTRHQSFHASITHQSSLRKWCSESKRGDEGRKEIAIELGTPGIAGRVGSRAHLSAPPKISSLHHLRLIDPARWVYTLDLN